MPRKYKQILMSGDDYIARRNKGEKFRIASIHETMGPHWKDIYWLQLPGGSKRPLVKLN